MGKLRWTPESTEDRKHTIKRGSVRQQASARDGLAALDLKAPNISSLPSSRSKLIQQASMMSEQTGDLGTRTAANTFCMNRCTQGRRGCEETRFFSYHPAPDDSRGPETSAHFGPFRRIHLVTIKGLCPILFVFNLDPKAKAASFGPLSAQNSVPGGGRLLRPGSFQHLTGDRPRNDADYNLQFPAWLAVSRAFSPSRSATRFCSLASSICARVFGRQRRSHDCNAQLSLDSKWDPALPGLQLRDLLVLLAELLVELHLRGLLLQAPLIEQSVLAGGLAGNTCKRNDAMLDCAAQNRSSRSR